MGSDGDPLSSALPHIQSSKSSSAGWCMKRRTGVLISPRSRRRKATAFPSLTFLEIWSSPVTTRAPGNWRPTLCQEVETRSGRCWRRRASAFYHPNHSGEVANVIIELKKIFLVLKVQTNGVKVTLKIRPYNPIGTTTGPDLCTIWCPHPQMQESRSYSSKSQEHKRHHRHLHQITIVLVIHNHPLSLQHLEQLKAILQMAAHIQYPSRDAQIQAWFHFIFSCFPKPH